MEPEAIITPPSTDLWAALTRVVERASPEDCPMLLGELERLKASVWLRMTGPTQKPASPPEFLLTAEEVAHRLRVTKDYVYRNASRYPFTVREGRYVRFSQTGLTRYLERHQGK